MTAPAALLALLLPALAPAQPALPGWSVSVGSDVPKADAPAAALELVYSFPTGTTLAEPDLRQAWQVWPEMIDQAKTSVDLETFYVTPSTGEVLEHTLSALKRAGERGVKIRVMLEKKFEKVSTDGIAALKAIPNLDLRVVDWSALNGGEGIIHAKGFVVDGTQAFVGSQNMDWRSHKHIHELGLRVTDPAVVKGLQAVFDHDWAASDPAKAGAPAPRRSAKPSYDRSAKRYLVASPWGLNPDGVGDSEEELVRLIAEATATIKIQLLDYAPLTRAKPPRFYAPIDNALRDAAARGVKVSLLVSHWNTDLPYLKHLQSLSLLPGVSVKVCAIPPGENKPPFSRVVHSKYMVVDDSVLWLGTSNWSGGYLDHSRNLEVVARDSALAERAAAIHAKVWDSPYSEPLDPVKSYPKPDR